MNIKSLVFGATGVAAAGFAILLTQGFNTPGVTKSTAAPAGLPIAAAETQSASQTTSHTVTESATNPNSDTKHKLPLTERIRYADIAAKNAVGGGAVSNLTTGTVQGQEVWQVTISHQGQQTLVVLLQSNNSVVSTTQVG